MAGPVHSLRSYLLLTAALAALSACGGSFRRNTGVAGPLGAASGGATSGGSSGGAFSGPQGRALSPDQRTIQEADIYKLVGNTLYILNALRSDLEIVDVTSVQSPKLLATVPTASSPRQIYVDGNTAYLLTSNLSDVDCGGYQGVCGWSAPGGASTQVDVVDVTSPAAPKVLGTQQISGDLQDSRIVGHILYVAGVDATGANTLVASYDVSNPQSFSKVAEVDFPFGDWDIGVFLNVTDTRIVVAQTGDTCDLVQDSGSCTDVPVTQFVPIDITDPNGAITLGTPFLGNGVVWDRWAMDFDSQSGIFRAVMSSDWNGNSGGGMLAVWSAPSATSAPTQLGSLDFTAGDHVTATAFAGPRVYVSSNSSGTGCPDPVVALDTTNPAQPALAGSVAVPGVNDFLYPNGNQLISLGHADSGTSNACGQGQGYVSFQGSGQLAVSLFDVSDPKNPTLLSQVTFGGTESTIAANRDDLKKAFLVLNAMGLILVPFQSGDPTAQSQSDTQLIDLSPSSLTLRGMAPHQGLVKRAFPVQNDVVAFSDESLQVVDISNRDQPTTAAQIAF
ncbi:MAG: beta-propeller domain-containing protein [Deltaproteobacteria bacterium]